MTNKIDAHIDIYIMMQLHDNHIIAICCDYTMTGLCCEVVSEFMR